MAFKNPTASGASSILLVHDLNTVAATYNYLFTIPSDVDSIVAKIWLDSTWSAAGSAVINIQTTVDGGTTWLDVSSTSIGAATVASTVNNLNAHFISIGCIGSSSRGVSNYIGSVASASLVSASPTASAAGITSGMPMVGTLGRVTIALASTITTGGINVQVFGPTGELR